MDEPLQDEGARRSAVLVAILDRLTSRYAPGAPQLLPVEALTLVYRAQLAPTQDRPAPTEQDLADALLLVTTACEDLIRRANMAELAITEGLRGHGWTWDQIGTHLGRPPGTARQNASSRYKRLREWFPWFQQGPPAT
jgi:hypothetical protein